MVRSKKGKSDEKINQKSIDFIATIFGPILEAPKQPSIHPSVRSYIFDLVFIFSLLLLFRFDCFECHKFEATAAAMDFR